MNAKMMRRTGLLSAVVVRSAVVPARAKNEFLKKPAIWRTALVAGLTLGLCLGAGPTMGADGMDTDAGKILKTMSTYLGGLPAFSASADVDSEVIDLSGQKLQFSSSVAIARSQIWRLFLTARR